VHEIVKVPLYKRECTHNMLVSNLRHDACAAHHHHLRASPSAHEFLRFLHPHLVCALLMVLQVCTPLIADELASLAL
jgi:hypothetical protein